MNNKKHSSDGDHFEKNKFYTQRINTIVTNYEKKIISRLNEEYYRKTKWSDRLADKIAAFGGSWRFIIFFAVFLVLWMGWNLFSSKYYFDQPPFILLNLILSFIAAFQAPVILMSQNRQAMRDKHESVIDYAINYKAEQEIDDMQEHLHRIEGELVEIKRLLQELHQESNPAENDPKNS